MILDWILDSPNANPPPPKEIVQLGRFENGLGISDSVSALIFLGVIMVLWLEGEQLVLRRVRLLLKQLGVKYDICRLL